MGTNNTDLGILGLQFANAVVILEINNFELIQMQSFKQNKVKKLRPKVSFLVIFKMQIENFIFDALNFLKSKVSSTKKIYLGIFWIAVL